MKPMKLTAAVLLGALAAPVFAEPGANLTDAEIKKMIEQGLIDLNTSRQMTAEEVERWGIMDLVAEIEQGGLVPEQVDARTATVRGPFLGVGCEPLSIEAAELLGLKRSTGLKVNYVPLNGPAGTAGLRKGDILTRLNDQVLVNAEQFAVLVRSHEIGDTITLHALREGKPLKLQATLSEADITPLGPGGRDLEQAWRFQINPGHGLVGSPLRPEVEIAPGLWIGDGWGNRVQGGINHEALPDEVKKMIEEFQAQMRQQRQDMDRLMQQMLQQLDLNLDDMQGQFDAQPGRTGASASAMVSDGEHEIKLVSKDGARHLTIKDKNGKVIFDGPIPDNGQVPGLDKDIQSKVDKLIAKTRIEIRNAPALEGQPVPPVIEPGHVDADQLLEQLRQQLGQNLDDAQSQPGNTNGKAGATASASGSAMMSDGEHEIKLVSKDGARHLTIKDKNGKVIFDGPMPDNGQVPGLDKGIQAKVDKMIANTRIEIRNAPAPKEEPAPKADPASVT